MYALTHDAFSLGFVGLAKFVPMVLLTLVVGHVADRFERRKIVFLCQILESAVAALLLAGNLVGWLGSEQILLAAAVIGTCRAFEGPSSSALLPDLVPKEDIQKAISWSTSAGQTSQILGPLLGGLLYSLGPSLVYITAAIALFSGGVLTGLIRKQQSVRNLDPVSIRSLFSGLSFVYRHPVILGTISLDLLRNDLVWSARGVWNGDYAFLPFNKPVSVIDSFVSYWRF